MITVNGWNGEGAKHGGRLGLLLGLALLAGCASTPQERARFAPTPPLTEALPPATEGAIFQSGREISLFQDTKARRVGDMITIVLVERTQASKQASTSSSKDQQVGLENPTLLGSPLTFRMPGRLPLNGRDLNLETSISGTRSFSGEGDSSQSNQLSGQITVTVADVLPNGNLIVRGEKSLTINQGDESIQFAGIVRPADIGPDNTVLSTLVADAEISYTGKGSLADANSMGWLGRLFNSKWWPF